MPFSFLRVCGWAGLAFVLAVVIFVDKHLARRLPFLRGPFCIYVEAAIIVIGYIVVRKGLGLGVWLKDLIPLLLYPLLVLHGMWLFHEGGGLFRSALARWRLILGVAAILVAVEFGLRILGVYLLGTQYADAARDYSSPKSVNIVCLGESTTEGLWLDFKDSYPKQLEARLRDYYSNPNIHVIVPVNVGQNTSEMANRMDKYIRLYHPKLIILMAGINNGWSLSESHIARFIRPDSWMALTVRGLVFIDQFRVFRVLRWSYLRIESLWKPADEDFTEVLGGPGFSQYPPPGEIFEFANLHPYEFLALWRYDIRSMIRSARAKGVPLVLMTYHSSGGTPLPQDFVKLANEEKVPLIRNDLTFGPVIKRHELDRYVLPRDHWHPNREGYKLIAENVFHYITSTPLLHRMGGGALSKRL